MTPLRRGLVVSGSRGHARSVAGIALTPGIEELIFVDDRPGSFVLPGAGAVVIDKVCIANSIAVRSRGVVIQPFLEPRVRAGAPARPVNAG
jgi:hypothetical protein